MEDFYQRDNNGKIIILYNSPIWEDDKNIYVDIRCIKDPDKPGIKIWKEFEYNYEEKRWEEFDTYEEKL